MAQQALTAGTIPSKWALFGLLDADGWTWAGIKAFIWLVIITLMLAYIPDRAYYFTVNRTVELGLLAWSPVNLCPPGNESLPVVQGLNSRFRSLTALSTTYSAIAR